MAESKGWIKLHRQLQDCPIWYGERFSKGQAWVDLLLLANHRDKRILFNGEIITIKRGQYLTSMVKLAEKWSWDRKTVSKFLNLLENDKMITKQTDNTKTLVTIENYSIYQSIDFEDVQPYGQPYGQGYGQPYEQPYGQHTDNPMDNPMDKGMDTNKNEKNDKECNKNEKNVKNNIFVPPTVDEVKEYLSSVGSSLDAESFVAFYESKGWMIGKNKMKSWKSAIVTWEKKAGIKRVKPKREPLPFEPTEEERELSDEEWLKMMKESDL